MTINEYQKLALRTEKPLEDLGINCVPLSPHDADRLTNGLMGLCGESGEAMDILKKCFYQGHPLDHKALVKELGDVAWYLALAADALGYSLEEIMAMNIEKLRIRYPEGFSSELSVNRAEDDK